jgi:two-component system response regulator YesN
VQTGKTIIEKIIEVRNENACRILKSTDLPVIDIAGKCGYNNPSYFYTSFKKMNGITPTEYRKKAAQIS